MYGEYCHDTEIESHGLFPITIKTAQRSGPILFHVSAATEHISIRDLAS